MWFIIAILVSGVSIGIIYAFTVKPESLEKLYEIPLIIILIAILAHLANLFFWSLRIKILAKSVGENLKIYRCFKIVMVNLFMAAITPSAMGGEPTRIYMLAEGNMSGGDATAITIGERIIDFIFFGAAIPLLLLLLGMSMDLGSVKIYLFISGAMLAVLGIFLVYLVVKAEKVKRKLHKLEWLMKFFVKDEEKRKKEMEKMEDEFIAFAESTKTLFKRNKKYLAASFVVTVAMWVIDFTIIPLILIGLGYEPNWLFMFTAQLIIVMVTLIPVTPGGTGLAEFTALLLISQRVPSSIAGIVVILWRALTFYTNLILGLVYTLNYIAKK